VLLLDEPLAALDRKLREETRFELMELQARLGLTFVIVTHDREEAMTLGHRIAVMDRGRIVQVAPPAEIYEQPHSRFIAEFLGDVNIIEGGLVSADADGTVIEAPGGLRLRAGATEEAKPGDRVFLAVRPEKIRIAPESEAGGEPQAFAGRVIDVAYLGDVSIYQVRLDAGPVIKAAAANLTRLVRRPIGTGDRVRVSWQPDAGIVLTR
jgi:putrescine transport system ATP-binding protein